jgi:hypothetical protein
MNLSSSITLLLNPNNNIWNVNQYNFFNFVTFQLDN